MLFLRSGNSLRDGRASGPAAVHDVIFIPHPLRDARWIKVSKYALNVSGIKHRYAGHSSGATFKVKIRVKSSRPDERRQYLKLFKAGLVWTH